jgi:hypothetical protein
MTAPRSVFVNLYGRMFLGHLMNDGLWIYEMKP